MDEELCFGCAKTFAEREPSIVIDGREFCIDCAATEADELGSATTQSVEESDRG